MLNRKTAACVYLYSYNADCLGNFSRSNILLDVDFHAKLGDFGFAVELPRMVGDHTLLTATAFARTEGYYPPEISPGLYSPKSDVYSYEVVRHLSLELNRDIMHIQVVLETCTRQKAFSERREDRRLVSFLMQDRMSVISA